MQERTPGEVILERFIESLRQRTEVWHARPDAESSLQFVLDDGTGDIELHFAPLSDGVQVTLSHLGCEKGTHQFPSNLAHDRAKHQFEVWLAEGLSQITVGDLSRRQGQGRSRFMVTLDQDQLDRLRVLAVEQGVPVTELVRAAVDQYLATK